MSEEKKIIIDEDWKSQVQAEKEALDKDPQEEQADSAGDAPNGFPPASFDVLVSFLTTEAFLSMGLIAGPDGQAPPPNRDQAKFFIDLLGVLQEKTKGNLSDQEDKGLDDLLHQLRMTFVSASGGSPPTPGTPGVELP